MKRLSPILLALFLLLTGCTHSSDLPDSSPIPAGPDILDNKAPADDIGALYYTGTALPEAIGEPYLYALGEDLLFLYIHYIDVDICNLTLYRMSTGTGEITHKAVIPSEGYGTVQVHGDTVCLSSAPSGKVWFLSAELELLKEYSFEANYNSWYVSTDLSTLYQLGWDTGLFRYALSNGAMTQLLPPESSVTYREARNDEVSFSYVDPESQMTKEARLDLTTGQITPFPREGVFQDMSQQGDLWTAAPYNREGVYLLGQGDTLLSAFTRSDCYVSLTDRGALLCRDYLTGSIGLYDIQGKLLSKLQLPMSRYGPSGYISDFMAWDEDRGGYFLLLTTFQDADDPAGMEPTQTTELMFWDLNAEVAGEDLVFSDYDASPPTPGGTTADPALYARAKALGEQYGVTILIADQCAVRYTNYETYTVSDDASIALALDQLEKALGCYPKGFFDQLRYDTIQGIEFSLVGELTTLREDEFGGVTAFAQPLQDKYIIVANLALASDMTFHHELSHVIDKRLQWDADHRTGALFSEDTWASMNPAGFDYDWTYALHLNRWNYSTDHFMSSYACTYPTEDRATVWEQAMIGNSYPFQSGPLREKLAYYANCVRDCFDTTGWPESVP